MQIIGQHAIRPELKVDTDKFKNFYNSVETLSALNSEDFITMCNKVLVDFLLSITGRKMDSMDSIQRYSFSVCLESIYHIKNRNLVLPHTFISNLIQTVTSGSRTVTDINAKISPAASDPTYRRWFYNQGLEELTKPSGNIDVYVDNIGKYVEKSYRVNAQKNKTPTVVSAVLNIPLKSIDSSMDDLQQREELKPKYWKKSKLREDEIQREMEKVIEEAEIKFRELRFNYVNAMLDYLSKSTEMENDVEKEVAQLKDSKYTQKCDACLMLHLPRKQKCICGGHVSSIETEGVKISGNYRNELPKYFSIGEILHHNPANVTLNEPIMVNPNSLKNLRIILDTLKPILIGSERKWVFIGADGPPYTLLRRIIKEEPEKYDWVVIVSGRGHLGMNQVKTFFKVIDKVFGEVLGKDVLNFTSPKA